MFPKESSTEKQDHCGLAAVQLFKDSPKIPDGKAAFILYKMLLRQQHRGQLSAGITTFNRKRSQLLRTYKKTGMVNEAFRASHSHKFAFRMRLLEGDRGIGHVRYATCGLDDETYSQPFERVHGRNWKWFSFGFNGQICNYPDLKEELEKANYHLIRQTDTELMMHTISKQLVGEKRVPLKEVFGKAGKIFDGAYNIVYLNARGELAAVRDPLGFKPLCYVKEGDSVLAASESVAFPKGDEKIKHVKPGEMLLANESGFSTQKFAKSPRKAHCMFEWVYFASPNSNIEGKVVYDARFDLGRYLAKNEQVEPDEDSVVVPVPDTAKPAGDALAFGLGIPSKEGILRNRYIGRTFIEGKGRAEKVREKYTLVKSILKNKKVYLVEDSVVRGTTTKGVIDRIKKEGKAKEVHLRVSCPPILAPCFYGIDMSTVQELAARKFVKDVDAGIREKEEEKMAKSMGVDSLQYLPRELLPKAIGLDKNDLCMACLNSKYPTPCGRRLYGNAVANLKKGVSKRTYECVSS